MAEQILIVTSIAMSLVFVSTAVYLLVGTVVILMMILTPLWRDPDFRIYLWKDRYLRIALSKAIIVWPAVVWEAASTAWFFSTYRLKMRRLFRQTNKR